MLNWFLWLTLLFYFYFGFCFRLLRFFGNFRLFFNFWSLFMMLFFVVMVLPFMMTSPFFSFFFILSLFVNFLTFFFWFVPIVKFLWRLFERLGNISHSRPIFNVLSLLSSHFNEKSSGKYFFIEAIPDEIDGVDPCLEYDFERSWIVFFDFDECEVTESFLNVLLDSSKVAFDQVQSYVLKVVIHTLNLID